MVHPTFDFRTVRPETELHTKIKTGDSMATISLNQKNFQDTLNNNAILLIDFWADWCGPCKMFGPVFEKVSEKHQDIAFAKVDTQEQQELAAAFGIQSIPTLAIFRDQILLYKNPGALPENALDDLIQQVRDLNMDDIRREIEKQETENGQGHQHDHDHDHDHDHEHHHGHDHEHDHDHHDHSH